LKEETKRKEGRNKKERRKKPINKYRKELKNKV
jgi:hypothetical protein